MVSSQGSSNIVDSSSQHMDTDYDDIEPPLTISTDEVRTRKEGDTGLFIKLVPKFFITLSYLLD